MGFFDILLTAIAPERAVKRVAAQTAIRAINSGYSNYGASLHKKSMRGWMWHGGSPKEDIEDNLRVLRERSRDAYMGVPLATGAIKTMRTNVVCGGLTPTPQIDNAFLGISDEEAQKINEQIAREFALWANKPTCDADRIDNFYMLQQLAFTGFLLNGDSWAVLQNKKTPGVPYDLRVRIIEADRICSPAFMDILSPTDINEHHVEKIVQGVETDADGMVIAYWVCDRHPLASTSVTGLTASHWTRVEAYGKKTGRQNVLCLMQRERAGQLRGVPLLAPVLESLKQLGRFTDAELTAAVISAMFTVFIKKSDQSDEVPFGEMLPPDVQVDTPDKTSVELAPGAYTDSGSDSSDSLSIKVNAMDHKWIDSWMPDKEAALHPTLCTTNWIVQGDRTVLDCGTLVVDDLSFSACPDVLTIGAVARPNGTSFHEKNREQVWKNTSIKRIAETIAGRYGLECKMDAEDVSVALKEQDDNDSSFLQKICGTYGLILKTYRNKIWIFDREQYKKKDSVATVKPIDIVPGSLSWNTTLAGTYTGGEFTYSNQKKKVNIKVTIGTADRMLKLNQYASSEADAKRQLQAAIDNKNHSATTISFTTMGNLTYCATQCIDVEGYGKIDGKYYMDSVGHTMNKSGGFVTKVSASRVGG